ncbi:MAG: hypothetical protein IJ498_04345 [Akkermansia sp.]|nr:hypothetical protein [Akkermansia sp.]
MGTSVVRNLIGVLALIILSFLIGITAADNAKSAVMVIVAIAGIIGIIALGKNVWMGLFILIPIGQAAPLHERFPVYYVFAALILIYWCVLFFLGHARFIWRKLWIADLLASLFFIYMAFTFFRFPASNTAFDILFDINNEYVSVIEYPLCISALILYITYSCIPVNNSQFLKVAKWGAIIELVSLFLVAIHNTQHSLSLYHTATGEFTRLVGISRFAEHLCVFAFASNAHGRLFTFSKPIYIILSFAMALLSGFRKHALYLVYLCAWISILKKEYATLLIVFFAAVLSLVFINSSGILDQLPHTLQRSLSVIPGMNVQESIKQNGKGSNEWRVKLWKWALDSRTHIINNYVTGEGFHNNAKEAARIYRLTNRGRVAQGDLALTVKKRFWHSGLISTLQELGMVGVSLTLLFYTYAFIKVLSIGSAIRKTPYFKYFVLFTFPYMYSFIRFYFQSASTAYFLVDMTHMGFLKVFYTFAVENGDITPHKKQRYTPLLIQQESAEKLQRAV